MEPTCRSSLWLGRSVCLSLPPPSPLIQAGTAPRAQPGALLTPLSPSPQLGALAVTLGVLLALLGCAAAPDPALEEAWEEWKSLHAKEYPGEDETFRREIWEKNLRHIQQHNWEEAQGKHSYRLAMNHFGDLVPADTFPGDPSEHPGLDRGIRDLLGHPGLDPGIRDPSVHPGLDLGIGDSLEHPGLDVGIRDPLVYPGLDPGTGYPHPVPRGAAGAPGARLLPGGQWLVGLCGAASRAPLASHGFSFGDLQTNEEFKRLLNGFIPAQQEELGRVFRASETLKTPVRVDWRAKGYVTPVKNQVGTGWGVWPRLWESGQQNRAAASSQSPQIFWATPRSSSRSFGHGDFVAETSTGEATASLPGGFWGSAMTPPLRFPPHPGVLRVLLGVQCHGGLGGADVQADGEAGGAERAEPHRLHPKAGQPRLLRWPHGMGLPVRARQRRPQLGACLPLRGHGEGQQGTRGRAEQCRRVPAVVTPSRSQDNSRCRYNPRDKAANCSGFVRVAQGSEEALVQAVATVGPVSVSVDASSFRFYKSGIFGCGSGSWRTNHAMLAVGYGTTRMGGHNLSYWILKNSWTERWGEQGYMFLLKDAGNQCGVANQASYPLP
ncbi:uncharacterized protein LOC135403396 isoform X2 [Pseudopipra pipra]|uniref:uncharacterized protein LOC135403396 isoform X2 n=1 Tax=Pseudopipra pipra TaxID=415032 RepID=UPI003139EB3E